VREELVERARSGDDVAFAALVDLYGGRCYAVAYRILRDPHRAQDATQQALFEAWRNLPQLRDPERFDAWLYRLVVHACYTEARSHRRWNARVRVLAANPTSTQTDDVAYSVTRRDELEDAFRKLTPERRAVVVLHHYLGYPLTEIAEVLGIPEGTARSRLHYAVRQLRAALDDDSRSLVAIKERPA